MPAELLARGDMHGYVIDSLCFERSANQFQKSPIVFESRMRNTHLPGWRLRGQNIA